MNQSRTISQEDIAEFEIAKSQLRKARQKYRYLQRKLYTALELGAEIEPGPYSLSLLIVARIQVD